MITYQDFVGRAGTLEQFIQSAIVKHQLGELYQNAVLADLYDKQKNKTINEYVKTIFTLTGAPIEDYTASNNKIASNLFRRLNVQRCTYSLGNGVFFNDEKIKGFLGKDFDTRLWEIGYHALIHGVCFGFWNFNKLYMFPVTEFVPLWDEYDGTLKAGIRFWRLDPDKPMIAVLYELDGYTKYVSEKSDAMDFKVSEEKRPYKTKIAYTPVGDEAVIGSENYSMLPIIPFWGDRLHQSTLVGLRQSIDSFDLIRSGFANDLTDCSQIYWILENCGGMNDNDLAKFRDRLKLNHIAQVDADSGAKAVPYTQEIPFQARKEYLDNIKAGIYEDFGGLDVHVVSAGATNDHIDAAYQPMDENADDFEYQCIMFVRQLLAINGYDDTPIFKRNRISNQKEQTEMVLSSSQYLDDETILKHLPFISIDEVNEILKRKEEDEAYKYEEMKAELQAFKDSENESGETDDAENAEEEL